MDRNSIITVIADSVEDNGLLETLEAVFGREITVIIPFSKRVCDTPLDSLTFKPRCLHAFKKLEVETVGDVVDALNEGRFNGIKNLGAKSLNELKTVILDYGFSKLDRNEKTAFIRNLVDQNTK